PTNNFETRFRLEQYSLGGKNLRTGPAFNVSGLRLAAGFLWIYGPVLSGHNNNTVKLVLSQVSPRTLVVDRSWTLAAKHRGKVLESVAVAPGPVRTVWVGFERTLLRIEPLSGTTLRKVRLPARFAVDDVATDPAVRHLYVGTEPTFGGGAVFEYLASSGRQLPPAGSRLLRDSVGGVRLTAVPGGVFGSFRTGMLGETVRLSQQGLRNQPLHSSIFGWTMAASTVYGGGSLYLANDGGGIACITPRGVVVARTTLAALRGTGDLLTVDPASHVVYGQGRHGLVAITPPARCSALIKRLAR
ncbi:MAG: hypothetical protein ABJB47_14575, partial [Actinomycetota bacterium]